MESEFYDHHDNVLYNISEIKTELEENSPDLVMGLPANCDPLLGTESNSNHLATNSSEEEVNDMEDPVWEDSRAGLRNGYKTDDAVVKKRERSVNFSPVETRLLMDIVLQFRKTLEIKKTDNNTNAQKEAAWKKISLIFNATSKKLGDSPVRSCKTLRQKYKSLKKKNRKKCGQSRPESFKNVVKDVKQDALPPSVCSISPPSSPSPIILDTVIEEECKHQEDSVKHLLDVARKTAKTKSQVVSNQWTEETSENTLDPAKPNAKSKCDALNSARLELVELEKEIAKSELTNKLIEHELSMQQKKEEHEIKMLHLRNEERRKQEEHDLKMLQLRSTLTSVTSKIEEDSNSNH